MQLTEKYRPRAFDALVGQDKAVMQLKRILRNGSDGLAISIAGPSGCGKTTLARIIATEHVQGGYVTEYGSADRFTQESFNELIDSLRVRPLCRRAWIINEIHGISARIMRQMLDVIESLPSWACLIFTTTLDGESDMFDGMKEKELTPWNRRVSRVQLTRRLETGSLTEVYAQEVMRIARLEGLDGGKDLDAFKKLVTKADNSIGYALKLVDDGILL